MFKEFPVKICPGDPDSWREAGVKLNCSRDQYDRILYQCAPNEEKSSLVEFCLKGSVARIEKGLCVDSLSNGFLGVQRCNQFDYGCPDKSYINNEIYKYPACLEINTDEHCYVADPYCLNISRVQENSTDHFTTTTRTTAALPMATNLLVVFGPTGTIVVLGILIGIIILFSRCRWHVYKRVRTGASEEGVEGFFKGIGKGLLGLVTQPLGGVMNMASLAFDGVRRSSENDVVAIRMRLPRFINPYHGLEPYSWYRAQGNFILHRLRDEQRSSGIFVDFAPLSYDDRADLLFITDRTILSLSKNRFSPGYDVKWEVERERIMGIPEVTENKIVLTLKDKKGSLFSGSTIEISSPNPEILRWIQDRMERIVRQQI